MGQELGGMNPTWSIENNMQYCIYNVRISSCILSYVASASDAIFFKIFKFITKISNLQNGSSPWRKFWIAFWRRRGIGRMPIDCLAASFSPSAVNSFRPVSGISKPIFFFLLRSPSTNIKNCFSTEQLSLNHRVQSMAEQNA